MKAFTSTLKLALIGLMFCVTSLHAQWDTIKNYDENSQQKIKDIFFISNTGYAVGHEFSATSSTGFVGMVSKTTDGGLNWNTSILPPVIGNDTVIELRSVYFTTPNTGYATALCASYQPSGYYWYGSILKTTDGGLTWLTNLSTKNQINAGASVFFNSIQFPSLYSGFIAASIQNANNNTASGLIYSTTNGGNTWNTSATFTGTQASSLFFNSGGIGSVVGGLSNNDINSSFNDYYLETFPGQISRSIDGGNTWTSTYTDPTYGFSDIHFPSSQIGYAIGDSIAPYLPTSGDIMKTTDGGITWSVINTFYNFNLDVSILSMTWSDL